MRITEKEDLTFAMEWINNPEYFGQYQPLSQQPWYELKKQYEKLTSEDKWFIIEKKDGTRIGAISYGPIGKAFDIGYNIVPQERRKGYGSEAVGIIVDFLFLSKEIVRVQAQIDPRNVASQKTLKNNGFKKEGTVRKSMFIRGEWRDLILYSILREEWKEPKILTKTA